MSRKLVFLALAVALLALLTPSRAQAWGAYHVGYTHVGVGGVYHYGRTAAVGPYGAYAGGHTVRYGAYGGLYRGGYAEGYHYGYSPYGGYAVGGVRTGLLGGVRAGFYRRW